MKSVPLFTEANATLDANGIGTVYLAPNVYGTSWIVNLVSTNTNTPDTNQVTFTMYKNFVNPGHVLGSTYSGQNDSDDISTKLVYGDRLIGVWTGGNPGDQATMTVMGTIVDVR